jgi:predicted XRE-type DNA-binding protein
LKHPKRVDFIEIIEDLQEYADMTQQQIADEVGCSQFAISALLRGRTHEPGFNLGARLINLHWWKGCAQARVEPDEV